VLQFKAIREALEMAQTHTIQISGIPGELLRRLDERVRERGGNRSGYIRELVEREIRKPTLSEILAPFRQQVKESGISDEELMALFEEAREEVWQEKQTWKT
jgi:hypothetical protein